MDWLMNRIIDNIRTHLNLRYSDLDYYKAVFFLVLDICIILINLLLIGYYAVFSEPLFILIHIFTIGLVFISGFLVINGYSGIGTGILLYFLYVIILVGLLNTGGINSFLLPIFIVILTYFFYFRRLWESITISSLTILLLIIDLLIDYSELIDIPFRGRNLMIDYFGLITYTSSILLIVVFIIYYERTTSNLIDKEKKNERKYYNLFSNMENGFI